MGLGTCHTNANPGKTILSNQEPRQYAPKGRPAHQFRLPQHAKLGIVKYPQKKHWLRDSRGTPAVVDSPAQTGRTLKATRGHTRIGIDNWHTWRLWACRTLRVGCHSGAGMGQPTAILDSRPEGLGDKLAAERFIPAISELACELSHVGCHWVPLCSTNVVMYICHVCGFLPARPVYMQVAYAVQATICGELGG